jgi:hypothetical protein
MYHDRLHLFPCVLHYYRNFILTFLDHLKYKVKLMSLLINLFSF